MEIYAGLDLDVCFCLLNKMSNQIKFHLTIPSLENRAADILNLAQCCFDNHKAMLFEILLYLSQIRIILLLKLNQDWLLPTFDNFLGILKSIKTILKSLQMQGMVVDCDSNY